MPKEFSFDRLHFESCDPDRVVGIIEPAAMDVTLIIIGGLGVPAMVAIMAIGYRTGSIEV